MASSLSTTNLPFSLALHSLNKNDNSTPRRLSFYTSHERALRGVVLRTRTECRVARVRESAPPNPTASSLAKEPHKYFDQAILTVRSGDGGHGTVLSLPNDRPPVGRREKKKDKAADKNKSGPFKRDFDGSLILPVGGHGGDVVVYADESKDTLLELHSKSRFSAKRGGNVDSARVLGAGLRNGLPAPALRIPVPVGTVVRRKKGNLLADLAQHGDEVLVARGGQGGISLVDAPDNRKKKLMALTTNIMRDDSDKILIHGQPGEAVTLELILRVVADVGLVGLPNAGKSTLLAAITHAKPDIADYPFTTLMPNLGRLSGDPTLGAGMYASDATLADLPGLIEGAHLGKGLGRNFLRHLRRTRLLVHVVDAAAGNPVNDYITVKEELRMYNPEYLERPHIVVLNKIDLPSAMDKLSTLADEISKIGLNEIPSERDTVSTSANASLSRIPEEDEKDKELKDYPRPLAVVGVSVLKGVNVNALLKEIRAGLRKCKDFGTSLEPRRS